MEWQGNLDFKSLIHENLLPDASAIVGTARSVLAPLEWLQWLDANRLAGTDTTCIARCCRSDGSDLPALLLADPGSSVLASASEWLAGQEGLVNEITLRRDPSGLQQLVHRGSGAETLPLHLAGKGIPALGAETKAVGASTLLAVEEHEAHLHPTLQVARFDRLIETVRAGIPAVLETHSVYMLRAMHLAVLDDDSGPMRSACTG